MDNASCHDLFIYHDFPSYPMTMFKILGILAILAVGMIAIPDASAVRCSEDKNPIQSPSGKTACVFDDTFATLLERGWTAKTITTLENESTYFNSENSDNSRITATSLPLASDSISSIAELGKLPYCILPSSTELSLPRSVNIGEIFDVTITSSYDLTQEQIDEFNTKYNREYDTAKEIWDKVCPINHFYLVLSSANYEFPGPNVSYVTKVLNTRFYPPYYIYAHHSAEFEFKGEPMTIQMAIHEPITDDYYQYDSGFFSISPATTHSVGLGGGVVIYTDFNGSIVNLSTTEFASGQTDENAPKQYYIWGWNKKLDYAPNATTDTSRTSYDVPFEWIVEILEDEFKGHDPVEIIRRLGLNDTYAEGFLDAYPEYRTGTQSFNPALNWILPNAFGQSMPNLAIVNGQVVFTNRDNVRVPVHGVNVCLFDVSDDPNVPDPRQIMNGVTPACDVTNINGNFRIPTFLRDLQGGPTTPDIMAIAQFDTDDFRIIYYQNHPQLMDITRGLPTLIHYIPDSSSPRMNISGPIHNYGTINLPDTEPSSRASYITNSLQPVNEWYKNKLSYTPDKSIINWSPGTCLGNGLNPRSNILELEESHSTFGVPCHSPISAMVNPISALENPHTLRHEYAHQVQNQIYLNRDAQIVSHDCGRTGEDGSIHSPVHDSGPLCAWTEGWAFFMAIAYDENPIYQPNYMLGQWNFETRGNTETRDPIFANKDFVDGNQEGNVAAALYDIIDRTNENQDSLDRSVSEVWNVFNNRNEPLIRNIDNFKSNWDANGRPSLDNIFQLNTIISDSLPPEIPPTRSYSDVFDDLDSWVLSGDKDWNIASPDEDVPRENRRTNTVAASNDCDTDCIMTLNRQLDTSRPLLITFDRFVADSVDNDEGLYVQYSNRCYAY